MSHGSSAPGEWSRVYTVRAERDFALLGFASLNDFQPYVELSILALGL